MLRSLEARALILQESQALLKLAENIPAAFGQSVDLLSRISGKIICTGVGKNSLIAEKISGCLASVGIGAFFMDPVKAVHGDLGAIDAQDGILGLSYSGQAEEILPIFHFAASKHLPRILITAGEETPLTKMASCVLTLPCVREVGPFAAVPSTSSLLTMALGDALVMALSKEKESCPTQYQRFHPKGHLGYLFSLVGDVMYKDSDLPLVYLDQSMGEVIIQMSEKRLGCAGVVSTSGVLQGIISDGDLRRHMKEPGFFEKPAKEIMTSPPCFNARPDMRVAEVMEVLASKNVMFSFVVDESDKPIGFFRMHDFFGIKRNFSC